MAPAARGPGPTLPNAFTALAGGTTDAAVSIAPSPPSLVDPGPCAAELAAFAQRGGGLGLESPGMTSVDSWDQDCQWRVEDLEAGTMAFWAVRRGQGDAGGDEAVAYARHAVATDLSAPEFVNGALPPDKLSATMRRVHIARCVAGTSGVPSRLRVRFTVPAAGGHPQHVATDYRVLLPDEAKACIAKQLAALSFPPLELGKWAIVVRGLDTR